MAPSLSQAKARKWWIAGTAVLENLMFAAVLLGWSSLLLMLKKEGFYSYLCEIDYSNNTDNSNNDNTNSTFLQSPDEKTNVTNEDENVVFRTCVEQDEVLNRYFSIGSCLLSGVTVLLGIIMDKYGSRAMRLTGCLLFMVSCMCFAVGSLNTSEYSFLVIPAVCLNGMGGVVYVFTSFQIPNLFENIRSTMISLMIGSYSASAIVYMVFKVAYDAGVPFAWLMVSHAVLGLLTFVNCYYNIPSEPLPGPDDISYTIKFSFGDLKFDHKVSGQQFLKQSSSIGRRMSNVHFAPLESKLDIYIPHDDKREDSFLQVLRTPCVILSFVTMCITQLRLIAYMGWLELHLKASSHKNGFSESEEEETVEFYTFLFGLFQINCFLMAPVIGTVMDWKLKAIHKAAMKHAHAKMESKGEENEPFQRMKKRQIVSNMMVAFLITNVLLVLFGCIILLDQYLSLQVVAFLLHTIIRTFLHSGMGGLYACMYHFSHFGRLTGLASFCSAMFILLQDPLFVVINSHLDGDPFWVNVALLVISLSGFGLPFYLWQYNKRQQEECVYNTDEHLLELSSDVDLVPSLTRNNLGSTEEAIEEEEQALYLSINAITF